MHIFHIIFLFLILLELCVQAQKYRSFASYLNFMSLLFTSLNLSCNSYCYIQALQLLERTLSQAPEVLLDQPTIPFWDASPSVISVFYFNYEKQDINL